MEDKPTRTIRLSDFHSKLATSNWLVLMNELLGFLQDSINNGLLEMHDLHVDLDAEDCTLRLVLTPQEAIELSKAAVDDAFKQFEPAARTSTDKDIQALLDACGDYVQLVAGKLGYDGVRDATKRGPIVARFLFPQFNDARLHDKLSVLIQMHEFGEKVINGQHTVEGLPDQELNEVSEASFRKARNEVRNTPEIMEALTPIQLRLLEQVFFKLRIV